MTVRSTFALDLATESSIQRLAKLWNASKAEVVRRSVAEAEKAEAHRQKLSPLDALDWLQANGSLTEDQVQSWTKDSRRGWEEGWTKREAAPAAKSAPKTSKKP